MNRLREARFKAEKTQVQIALLTGIPQPKISFIENGFWNCSEEEEIRISNALGFERSWVFPRRDSKLEKS